MKRKLPSAGCCLVAVVLLLNAAITQAGFSPLGLHNLRVYDLEMAFGSLYAATNDGVYRRVLEGSDTDWVALGPPGTSVSALIILHPDTILCGRVSGSYAILRTADGGVTWDPFENGYGGGEFHPVLAFEQSPVNLRMLFATGVAVIAKSTDGGASWRPVWGAWNGVAMGMVFVKVDPYSPEIVWAGGEGAFFNPWLFKSNDSGETWGSPPIPYTGDNRCHDIAIYPDSSDVAWVSMEGKVIKTTDGGSTWETPYLNEFYLYRIAVDSLRPVRLYTGGGQGTRPLTLFCSTDGGVGWTPVTENSYPSNWMSDLLLVSGSDRNTLYLATQYGVFAYLDLLRFACGDVDGNGQITSSDVIYLVNYVFKGGPAPVPYADLGDVNCNGITTAADIIALVNFVFKSGEAPCDTCLSVAGP